MISAIHPNLWLLAIALMCTITIVCQLGFNWLILQRTNHTTWVQLQQELDRAASALPPSVQTIGYVGPRRIPRERWVDTAENDPFFLHYLYAQYAVIPAYLHPDPTGDWLFLDFPTRAQAQAWLARHPHYHPASPFLSGRLLVKRLSGGSPP